MSPREFFKSTVLPRFKFKKLRILLAWVGGAALFLNSHANECSFQIGVPIAIAGEIIRLWSLGFIERKGKKLATNGPFSYVRNPLYVGNFLLGLGIVTISWNPLLLAVFLVGFGVLYWGTVRKEEKELGASFGETYFRYLRGVPCFFPRWTPYPDRDKVSFQLNLLWKNREHVTLLGLATLLVGLYLWEGVVLESQFMWKQKLALAITAALIVALILEKVFRPRSDVGEVKRDNHG